MKQPEFLLDRILGDGLIVGANGYTEVPVGTVFTHLTKERLDGGPPNFTHVDLGVVGSVRLQLKEVWSFRESIPAIPRGHTAGVRLEGVGLDLLELALKGRKVNEHLTLRAAADSVVVEGD